MELFLIFLLASFALGLMHKIRYFWRFLFILILAMLLSFLYIFFRQI